MQSLRFLVQILSGCQEYPEHLANIAHFQMEDCCYRLCLPISGERKLR